MTKNDELKKAIVEAALELVDNLKENLQESVDNMSGTNLEYTERYQKYEQAAFELEDIVSFRKKISDNYLEALKAGYAKEALANLSAAEFYAWCLEKNILAIKKMKRDLLFFGVKNGGYGVMNRREIDPADVGLTACTITVAAGESSYTLTRDVKENCSLVIGGFYVNDTILREVEIWRGNVKLYTWVIRDGVQYESTIQSSMAQARR